MTEFTPPSKLFALEVEEVAEKAKDLADYVRTANLLPDTYQQEPLNLLCATLVQLPYGSAGGAFVTLDYARRRLPFFRPAARAKDQQFGANVVLRGEELDKKVTSLFMAVGSAIGVYLSETDQDDIDEPHDPAFTPTETERQNLADLDRDAQHIQQDLREIKEALDNQATELQGIIQLKRGVVDTQNQLGIGRAELSLPAPKSKLLAQLADYIIDRGEQLGDFCERFSYAAEPGSEEFANWLTRQVKGSVKRLGNFGRGLKTFAARWREWPETEDQPDAQIALPPYDEEEARAMIIRGEIPPEHWRSEIIQLDLSGKAIPSLKPLSALTSLEYLKLSGITKSYQHQMRILGPVELTSQDLRSLSSLASLKHLDLSNTQVSDLSALTGLVSLKSLRLENIPVSNLGVLNKLTSLEYLNLAGTKIVTLLDLCDHKSLKTVDIRGCMDVDTSSFHHKNVKIITSYFEDPLKHH